MSPQISKQFIVGSLLGLLASGAVWFALSSKRTDIAELQAANGKLASEVETGKQLKVSYESLKKETEEQEVRIEELIKLFPLESERTRVTQLVQRLAREARLGPIQAQTNVPRPVNTDYYTEYETNYRYNGGFMEFGHFLSYVSGFDKIINISDITMSRNTARNLVYPATIGFRLSVYVYDQSSMATIRGSGPAAPAPRPSQSVDED